MSELASAHAALVDAVLSHIRPSLRGDKRPLAELLAEEFELRARAHLRRLDNVIAEQERLGDQNVTLRRRAAALEAFIERYVDSATPDQIVAQWESDHPLPTALQEIKEVVVDIDVEGAIVVTDETLVQLQTTIAGLEATLRERAENEARLAEQCGTLSAQCKSHEIELAALRREAERQRSLANSHSALAQELRDAASEQMLLFSRITRFHAVQRRIADAEAAADLPF